MGGHLATVDSIFVAHCLFYEGVPGAGLHGAAARLCDDILRVPDDPRVVDDGCARVFGQERLGQKPDQIFAVDEGAGVVEEEATIEVAIPGNAEVSACGAHSRCGYWTVFGQKRVRDSLREGAVWFVEKPHEGEGGTKPFKAFRDGIEGRARRPVAGVNQNFQRLQGIDIDEGYDAIDVSRAGVLRDVSDRADRARRRKRVPFGQVLDPG